MRNNRAIAAAITFGAIAMLIAWADVNLAADKKSGGSRFGDILGGLGTLAGGLMPIGYEEEKSIGEAISLQVVARSGGIIEQPELVRYVNLVGQAVALTSDRPDIPYHFAVLKDDSINAFEHSRATMPPSLRRIRTSAHGSTRFRIRSNPMA